MATLHPQTHSSPHCRSHHRSYSHPSPSIPRTQNGVPIYRPDTIRDRPWQHMTQTYTWVLEQEHDKRDRKTEKWVLEQQVFISADSLKGKSVVGRGNQKVWEEMAYTYEVEAVRWMRQEEEARRVAAERERTKARVVQEELRRIEDRIRQRREIEKRRLAEERSRIYVEARELERQQRVRSDKTLAEAWASYETRWAALSSSSEPITFSDIPWPQISAPLTPDDIVPSAISTFLFSALHSQDQSRKDRIRSAQLRWHPDRFRRLMSRVAEDKSYVEQGVGIVARCLNDMMAREKSKPQHWSRDYNLH